MRFTESLEHLTITVKKELGELNTALTAADKEEEKKYQRDPNEGLYIDILTPNQAFRSLCIITHHYQIFYRWVSKFGELERSWQERTRTALSSISVVSCFPRANLSRSKDHQQKGKNYPHEGNLPLTMVWNISFGIFQKRRDHINIQGSVS